MLALASTAVAALHTVEDIEAFFGDWTADTAAASGYLADPFCVDGRVAGVPELGTMGFHHVKPQLMDSNLEPLAPEIIIVGPDGESVVAVEYIVVWQKDMEVPSIFEQVFDGPMVGHSPGMPVHYDQHVWLADNPAGQFADFNPALPLCSADTLPPPPSAEMVAGIFGGMPADAAVAIGYAPTRSASTEGSSGRLRQARWASTTSTRP